MSYLSRFLNRNSFHHGFHIPSKYFFTNYVNMAPKQVLFRPTQFAASPFTTVRIRPIKQDDFIEPGIMEHDAYNKCKGRPLSPHIRIYKKQLTSLLSFCHRLTGLMMLFYVYVVTAGTWLWPDITTFLDYLASLDVYVGEYWWHAAHRTVKFMVAYPFVFHSMNAVRHLSWDFGKLLGMKQIYSSGYFMQTLVIIIAMGLVFWEPFEWPDFGGAEAEGAADANADADGAKKTDAKGATSATPDAAKKKE